MSECVDCNVTSLYQCNYRFDTHTVKDCAAFETLDFSEFKFDNLDLSAKKLFFGPHFVHKGVVYGHSSTNYELMMRRQFALRVEDRVYDDWLRGNQELVRLLPGFAEWFGIVKERVETLVPGDDIQTLLYEYVHRPHPKRLIRIRAYESIRDSGRLEDYGAYCTGVTYKLKIPEFGAPGKLPRVIGDFGPEGSILGGFILEYGKKAFVEPILVNGLRLVFVPCPSTPALVQVFRELVHGQESCCYFFSDDSCFAFTLPCGRRVMLNMDISKCDGSVGDPIFEVARELLSSPGMENIVDAVIAQCKLPCTLRDPEYNKILTVYPLHHNLSSGTVLTTFLDNIATSVIALSIHDLLRDLPAGSTDAEIEALIVTGASFAGFIVTSEICPTHHHLQFLKHSPCMAEDGLLYPVMNLGVALRALGQKDGTFSYKTFDEFSRKCEQHNSGVVKGFVHMGNHSLHDALKDRFDAPSSPIYKQHWTYELRNHEPVHIPRIQDSELITRYTGNRYVTSTQDFDDLISLIGFASLGDAISCEASRNILDRDYGL